MNKTIDKNACAYKEIYEILKIFPPELVEKIPKEKISFFYNNMNKNYEYIITKETFDQVSMLEETAAILTILFRDYWAMPTQREKILSFEKNAKIDIENEARKRYNPEDIFKDQKATQILEKQTSNNVALTEYKESFFYKIRKVFLNLFRKK